MRKLEEVLQDWEAVIGLEIHAELTTLDTKMFCGCKLEFGAEPNTHTCPVCLGMPGALPVPNRAAIESIVLAGLATNCDIEKHSMFYRKTYMYPDMSKNYQTTQGPVAFCMRGHLDLDVDGAAAKERADLDGLAVGESRGNVTRTTDGYTAHVGITRIHMEEDAGKMVHIGGGEGRIAGATHSLVDYNRAGTPLTELVTEPDLRTPEEARLFMQKLRQIYLALGISDCSMEEGSMRCDGNVSLRRRGAKEFGVKTELKNMNSFKNLHDGLAYEICRQAEVLEEGGQIFQETRHWDPSKKRTIVMRVKETADDYRLFPDPDLAPYDLTDEWIESVRAKLPELPDQKAARFEDAFGLTPYDARHLVEHRETADFFEACMELAGDEAAKLAKPVANLVINDVTAYLNAQDGVKLADTALTPARALGLVKLVAADAISSKQGKVVFAAILDEDKDPDAIVAERGMEQVSDTGAIEAVVDAVLAANPDKVAQYQGGKTGLIGFFVGQCMKEMRGQGNPKLINELLAKKLG
ncbi:MAG: Asp-tRNA(Asn)/Glu-tRNA(Gln) amidotransferase subunit GatB [Gordonibacter pamelaeae]|jgi:aspartyl-tRNA(Asn)/glutamyl-tRNA(Gln) amidotransferase subunit B|uniref:Aspartyl/glutamyl-tRNA(Asn/Gln) amidotransferase subunit B n=3 Tax=Gordonibacter TaxID=644652 RepID=D6EBD6_9ACTN|nr:MULTISPECIES: Asp-tRNA(Asn)/Glu-tRNA(Gln) amidotransferase subunit GatB [Gordonibacter]HJH72502.1 Asp-tRNA(Asn)/Glu-tRNA(Gln) amidotransferase subunit GatB [Eggerthellaceae bacterium]MBS4895029.1 Asp-tRNA(Asn)/Glu-tRNA(Gln) amidotransferase subunit GatB [Gordonibacter pamelaeae]MCB6311625.1 Asp-tRNA(Asn)/Glu-tRNA(Gln) amidotransferase subunit GatB [Gordonibacter pamelaeae]MSA95911.1 Asp-tRNA(Asn)/Glu-tRNA(Gln) amidotransferase subunit GatB [Gordonibacter urolithinfaciens]RDB66407.1 Asp-tRNA